MRATTTIDITDLPAACIAECSQPGACDAAVKRWRKVLDFSVERTSAINYLAASGAWEHRYLVRTSDVTLAERILWMACCTFAEAEDQCLFLSSYD